MKLAMGAETMGGGRGSHYYLLAPAFTYLLAFLYFESIDAAMRDGRKFGEEKVDGCQRKMMEDILCTCLPYTLQACTSLSNSH